MQRPEIFIHVGMGRAGSTFLQYRVFPKIKGLNYIQRTRFRKAGKIIAEGKHNRYLVSGELDPRLIENYLKDFCDPYSYAKPILVIRRHDEWIASQYRRYLKNGNHWTFREFFDLEKDRGYWKQESLYYFPIIELLNKYFDNKPLVLLYDDLRKDPELFIRSILEYLDADIDMAQVDMSPKHASYREKQLRAVYSISGWINLRKKRPFKSKWKNVLLNLGINIIRYSVLYISSILPGRLIPGAEIFPNREQLAAIREAYDDDWQRCTEYAQTYNIRK
jgi:hypothetical protein